MRDSESANQRACTALLKLGEVVCRALRILLVVEKVIHIHAIRLLRKSGKLVGKPFSIVVVAKMVYVGATAILIEIKLGSKARASELQFVFPLTGVFVAKEHIYFLRIAQAHCHIRHIGTQVRRYIGYHAHTHLLRKSHSIAFEPLFVLHYSLAFIPGSGDIFGVVAIECAVAPAIEVDAHLQERRVAYALIVEVEFSFHQLLLPIVVGTQFSEHNQAVGVLHKGAVAPLRLHLNLSRRHVDRLIGYALSLCSGFCGCHSSYHQEHQY